MGSMGIGAVVHTFTVQLANIDAGIYEEISLRTARQPSETEGNLLLRVIAYALEFQEGIELSQGIAATKEPAVFVKDLTGELTAWIEVGAPDAARLHYGSKLAGSATVYTQRDPERLAASWHGKTLHRGREIQVIGFEPHSIDNAAEAIERRNELNLTLTEGTLYLELNGKQFSTPLLRTRAA
jgi:uncharacterized protein YaeQ